jgi:hypothetical protein
MFDQSFFDNLLTTVTQINEMWEEFAGDTLIKLPSANIITHDGATYRVRFNFGRMNDNEDLLYVAAYDVETDRPKMVCIPFSEIERVEVFDGTPADGRKTVRFETAKVTERCATGGHRLGPHGLASAIAYLRRARPR